MYVCINNNINNKIPIVYIVSTDQISFKFS